MLFVIGWRGEPSVCDEPQHIYQGEVTLRLLENMGVEYAVIDGDTSDFEIEATMKRFRILFQQGKQAAFVIRRGGLVYKGSVLYQNTWSMSREETIRHILKVSGNDPVIATTGKASRELFEI